MFPWRRDDPLNKLVWLLRQARDELRIDAAEARKAAAMHKREAARQRDTAMSLIPEDEDA